jgi:hypothetical protein
MASKGTGVDKSKLIMASIAGIAVIGVAAWLAYYFGVFGQPTPPPPPADPTANLSPEEKKQADEDKARIEQINKTRAPSGS